MKALIFNKDRNMDVVDIGHSGYLFDARSKFAIWCCGEGWCPAFGPVSVFNTFEQALRVLNEWQEENPDSKYEIREVV